MMKASTGCWGVLSGAGIRWVSWQWRGSHCAPFSPNPPTLIQLIRGGNQSRSDVDVHAYPHRPTLPSSPPALSWLTPLTCPSWLSPENCFQSALSSVTNELTFGEGKDGLILLFSWTNWVRSSTEIVQFLLLEPIVFVQTVKFLSQVQTNTFCAASPVDYFLPIGDLFKGLCIKYVFINGVNGSIIIPPKQQFSHKYR